MPSSRSSEAASLFCSFILTSCDSRTDHDFRLKLQQSHHVGTSNLESIPNINMVDDFPSDPMHLIFLGIVKKLVVSLWCFGKSGTKLSTRISSIKIFS